MTPRPSAHGPGFAAELRRQREAAGLSQHALGGRVGCGRGLISRLEAGQRHPSLAMAVRLAVALSGDEATRCRLVMSAGFVPPGYEVVQLRRIWIGMRRAGECGPTSRRR